jgi:hypothetical protein
MAETLALDPIALDALEMLQALVDALSAARYGMRDAEARDAAAELCRRGQDAAQALAEALAGLSAPPAA